MRSHILVLVVCALMFAIFGNVSPTFAQTPEINQIEVVKNQEVLTKLGSILDPEDGDILYEVYRLDDQGRICYIVADVYVSAYRESNTPASLECFDGN